MADKARLAIVGCGAHSSRIVLPSLREASNVELVAACDRDEAALSTASARFGVPARFTDLDHMLTRTELDGVLVIGPPAMQVELGRRVLEKSLPVYVEKPSALTAEEAKAFATAADAAGTFGMVAFMKRFAVAYRIARAEMLRPEFGTLAVVDAKFGQGAYPRIWGLGSPEQSFLTGQVIHVFDLVSHFAGRVVSAFARLHRAAPERFAFTVSLRFAGGAIGQLNLNTLDARTEWSDFEERLVLTGTDHHVVVDDMLRVRSYRKDASFAGGDDGVGRSSFAWEPSGPAMPSREMLLGYVGEIEHFAACCLTRQRPSPDLHEGAHALEIAEAVWQSVETGEEIRLRKLI